MELGRTRRLRWAASRGRRRRRGGPDRRNGGRHRAALPVATVPHGRSARGRRRRGRPPGPADGDLHRDRRSRPAQPAGRQRPPVRAGPAGRDAHVHDLGRRRPGTADRRARPAGRGRRAPVREPDLAVGQPHPAGHEHHPARHHHPGRRPARLGLVQLGSRASPAPFTPVPSDSLPGVPPTPQQLGRRILAAIGPTTVVSVRDNVTVAGQPAYQLVLAPKDSRSLIGQVTIAIDARHSLPLRVQVFARGASSPAVQAGYTALSFGAPAASNFTFTPPPGAKVKTINVPAPPPRHPVPRPPGAAPGMSAGPGPGRNVRIDPATGRPEPGSGTSGEPGHHPAVVGTGWLSVLVVPPSVAAATAQTPVPVYDDGGHVVAYASPSATVPTATPFSAAPGRPGRAAGAAEGRHPGARRLGQRPPAAHAACCRSCSPARAPCWRARSRPRSCTPTPPRSSERSRTRTRPPRTRRRARPRRPTRSASAGAPAVTPPAATAQAARQRQAWGPDGDPAAAARPAAAIVTARPDQAVPERPARRRRPEPGGPVRRRCTASSGRTARARPRPSGCCSAWSIRPAASTSCSARPCPRRPSPCCRGSGRWSRGRPSTRSCPAGPTWPGATRPTGPPTRRTAAARIGAALDLVGLGETGGKHYRAYSLGMKQRLAIAAGLLRPRDLLILDEPTNGLDPQGTREVRALIRQIAADGDDRVRVLAPAGRGRADLLARRGHAGRAAGLRGHASTSCAAGAPPGSGSGRRTRSSPPACWPTSSWPTSRPATAEVSAQLGDEQPEDICARLVHAGVRVAGLESPRPSLEDLFVELTGEGFDVSG